MTLSELEILVRKGEGLHIEFKRKANHPDKIARELVAFHNTDGGILLIGVDDDKTIYGCKSAEEDEYLLNNYFIAHCVPKINFKVEPIRVNAHRVVLAYHVRPGRKKPYFVRENGVKTAYVRVADMSITASRELIEVLRFGRSNVQFAYGERERKLLTLLEAQPSLAFADIQRGVVLSEKETSQLLITLTRAGIIHLQPTMHGDRYSLAETAF